MYVHTAIILLSLISPYYIILAYYAILTFFLLADKCSLVTWLLATLATCSLATCSLSALANLPPYHSAPGGARQCWCDVRSVSPSVTWRSRQTPCTWQTWQPAPWALSCTPSASRQSCWWVLTALLNHFSCRSKQWYSYESIITLKCSFMG